MGDFSTKYFTIRAIEPSVVKFSYSSNHYYSTDSGTTWSLYTANQGISLAAGETVMFKCVYNSSTSTQYSFSASTGNIEVEGNPMSLVYGDDFIGQTTHKAGAYRCLFSGCTALTSCENLDFTDAAMSDRTCDWMFTSCTNLEKAPAILPAMTLANNCYCHMFRGCTKLEKSPILPAETAVAYSYNTMFYGCTMLNEITCYATNISNTTAYTDNWVTGVAANGVFHKNMDKITAWVRGTYGIPPAWDVAENDDCFTVVAESTGTVKTNIGVTYASVNGGAWTNIGANAINVNAGDEIRYEMSINPSNDSYALFGGSTAQFHIKGDIQSLNYGVNYKNQTVTKNYAFKGLFSNCTGLTRADELIMPSSSAGTQSMRAMFQNCTSLQKAPELPATGVGASGYSYMFSGCTSLVEAPEIEAERVSDYACHWMFGGCSSLTKAPSILPATATTTACYQNMFEGCTSLTKSPILPAETVATYAYHRMFSGCTSLSQITCLAISTGASNCTSSWVANVAPTGTFIGNKNKDNWTRGNNGIPTSWVYEDYEFELTFIDLGLPSGTLWCRNNVGAKSACAYGNYYQYGQGLKTFQESSATTQYNGHRAPLEAELDTATATYGDGYAMPTQTQLYELAQYCNITNQTVNGVTCLKFTSKADSSKYIYVPAAGYYHNNGTFYGGTVQFWSSTPSYEGQYAYEFNSDYGASGWVYPTNPFNMGFSVRAVKNKGIEYIDMGLPSGTLWGNSNIGYEGGWYYKLMNGDQGYLYGQTVGAITDTATALLGAGKKIPTKEQFEELFANTTRQWVSSYQGGRWSGILYTSTVNGNQIFFPAAGSIATNGQYGGGNVQVSLVCSTPSTTAGYCTNYWGNNTTELTYSAAADRNYGLVVRPVMNKATSKLYLGDINIENIYLGDLRPTVYLGDTLVYG